MFAIAALALSGCTSTQLHDGSKWAAGQLLTTTLDVATGSGKADSREYEPGRRTYCDLACEHREEARIDAAYAEYERLKRRAESKVFKAEFDAHMTELEEAGQQSLGLPAFAESKYKLQH